MLNKPNLLAARFLLCSCVLLVFSAACNRSKPQPETSSSAAKRYPFKGKIISVDKNASTANIDNEPIAGFMDPMIMPYSFKPASALDQLQPGDTITADVVVQAADNKYWLENVKVVSHTDTPASKPTATMHIPAPGDDVPDFHLINQNGKRISLHQYRGETLLLTLIYTRCPFPDFCPRVSHEFAAIDHQLRADPAHYGKTHLLSISFDPEHDTPKVLRAYGFSSSGSKDPTLFNALGIFSDSVRRVARLCQLFRADLRRRRRPDHPFAKHRRHLARWKNLQVVSRRRLAGLRPAARHRRSRRIRAP